MEGHATPRAHAYYRDHSPPALGPEVAGGGARTRAALDCAGRKRAHTFATKKAPTKVCGSVSGSAGAAEV